LDESITYLFIVPNFLLLNIFLPVVVDSPFNFEHVLSLLVLLNQFFSLLFLEHKSVGQPDFLKVLQQNLLQVGGGVHRDDRLVDLFARPALCGCVHVNIMSIYLTSGLLDLFCLLVSLLDAFLL
jgi:hypothetical protein